MMNVLDYVFDFVRLELGNHQIKAYSARALLVYICHKTSDFCTRILPFDHYHQLMSSIAP